MIESSVPADAIADGIDLFLAGDGFDSVERGDDAFAHVFFEAFVASLASGLTHETTKTVMPRSTHHLMKDFPA